MWKTKHCLSFASKRLSKVCQYALKRCKWKNSNLSQDIKRRDRSSSRRGRSRCQLARCRQEYSSLDKLSQRKHRDNSISSLIATDKDQSRQSKRYQRILCLCSSRKRRRRPSLSREGRRQGQLSRARWLHSSSRESQGPTRA